MKLFLQKKLETKAIKISVLYCLPVEKFNRLLECLLLCTRSIIYPKCMDSGVETTIKPNELTSFMAVRRRGFHNGLMTYMLQFSESTIRRIFVTRKVFMEAKFSCLNLKPGDGFLAAWMRFLVKLEMVYRHYNCLR